MSQRLSEFRDRGPKSSAGELVAELETAMEELRVTGEEIAAQRQHISDLLRQSSQARATVDRLVGAMPTPVLSTDRNGLLLEVNPAAARLLGVPLERLHGKPLTAYIAFDDRRTLRTMLSEAADGGSPGPRTVRVTPRGDGQHEVTLIAVPSEPDPDADGTPPRIVRWFVDLGTFTDGAGEAEALLASIAELVTLPSGDDAVSDLLPRVAEIAVHALPEVTDATVTVGDPRRPELLTSTSARAQAADAAQLEAGEGPCVEAFLTDKIVASDRLGKDARWPTLARRIRLTGVDATMGVPIHGDSEVYGVLNLYAPAGVLLDQARVRDRAELFARAASSLVEDNRRVQQLREESRNLRQALTTRPEIDQAKGILMARFGYSADDAFQHLVAVSQKRNVKLREIARDIVAMVRRDGVGPVDQGAPGGR